MNEQERQVPSGFRPTEGAARDLGSLAGDISQAGNLLDGQPPQPSLEDDATEPRKDEGLFDVHTRARIDLGDPTVESEISELAETDEPPTTYEITRESIIKGIENAFESWYKFGGKPGLRLPRDFDHFSRFNRDMEGTLDRLTKIKLDLIAFGKTSQGKTEKGYNLGRSLQPLLVPWEFFASNIESTNSSVDNSSLTSIYKQMQEKQGIEEHVLDDPSFLDRNAFSYYRRDPNSPWRSGNLAQYVQGRFNNDGWWGVVLAQTGLPAGRNIRSTLDELTNGNRNEYRVDGYRVDALGILEWIALTLQEDPRDFTGRRNIMMANFDSYTFEGNSKRAVQYGIWDEKNKRIGYGWVEAEKTGDPDCLARIAIHPWEERLEEEDKEQ